MFIKMLDLNGNEVAVNLNMVEKIKIIDTTKDGGKWIDCSLKFIFAEGYIEDYPTCYEEAESRFDKIIKIFNKGKGVKGE